MTDDATDESAAERQADEHTEESVDGASADAEAAERVDHGGEQVEGESATDGLAARAAEYDDDLAADVAALQSRADELESDLDEKDARVEELESGLRRTQADFKNYKKRAQKKQDDIRDRATEDLVARLVGVRDNLLRALDQEESADIRPGVESTLKEFDRVLDDENVEPIEPDAGEPVDPQRHEVMMRVDSDHPEGTVADVYQPGYEMAEKVIRAAQVTVSKGDE
ncbi:molecular chaperone GrpE [Haloprofundus marisrubri]|uniref:Protein GrpE n=1 Tax=Haloprofundus marisrubri TaxID=1514971 RepID=A0A0W1RCY9_9EURY|nr:nucleotide exchange factor GrpE [Haloprofundus marisrubri]KTG11120.1 molecular chaperone GrpE [Haloprofundus marisrubri]